MARESGAAGGTTVIASARTATTGRSLEDYPEYYREHRQEQAVANPRRASLFDLLFDEVDAAEDIDHKAKQRLKQTIRRKVAARRRPSAPVDEETGKKSGEKAGEKAGEETGPHDQADLLRVVLPAAVPADEETLAHLASDEDREAVEHDQKVQQARLVAEQLRYCLTQHTETSRKVSVYLRAVLFLNSGDMRPRMIIEV